MNAWKLPTSVTVCGQEFAIRSDYRAVLDAVTPLLTQSVEAAAKASAARIAKHADAYQGSTAGLAPEQQ